MKTPRLISLVALLALAASSFAQEPIANPLEPALLTPVQPATAAIPVDPNAGLAGVIQVLEEMKATNADLIRKQEATLELIDQLTKEADQLRIFAKRG